MRSRRALLGAICILTVCMIPYLVRAEVISGKITHWEESGPTLQIGDGVNYVKIHWSYNYYHRGWFYAESEVYMNKVTNFYVGYANGVTDISQINDASIFNYGPQYIGPYFDSHGDPDGTGDFIVWKNMKTGYYGVLRIDDIVYTGPPTPVGYLNGTWWFQTDGTGNFSSVPEPSSILLFLSGTAVPGILFRRRVP